MNRGLIALLALLCASSANALAGTTGGVNGTVIDAQTSAPIANARVTVIAAAQSESAATDGGGHFSFVSLSPDTYTLSVQKTGYESFSYAGIVVFADNQQTVSVRLHPSLKTIASVTSRSSSDLVRPGTTADVYSVNAAQQARVSALGGGGNLNSAFSAIASVPGAYVPANQAGYLQAVHVRGGDGYEVGYEFDGVPVNRSFDNYPSNALSSLGQQELQVYTGATPANGEAQGLAGFVNQVIKSGTYPGFGSAELAFGTPAFYHSLNVEAGGSSPNRLFSYYAGIGAYNQDFRYVDQFDGAAYQNEFGPILDQCIPSPPPTVPSCFTNGKPNVGLAGAPGYVLGPIAYGGNNASVASVSSRTAVLNLHVGLPHRRDSGRDDIQILYDNDELFSPLYNSIYDEGLNNFAAAGTYGPGVLPYYTDYYQYTGETGVPLPSNYASLVKPYYFPSSPQNRPFDAAIPLTARDMQFNGQAIVKLQYQRNFSASSYLRVYGYTYYSDYIASGPISSWQPYTGFDSGDYEVSSHTRGVSATFAAQLGSHHLLQAQASYTTAKAIRIFNEQMFGGGDNIAELVNPSDLTHGICYSIVASSSAAVPTSCNDPTSGNLPVGAPATYASLGGIANGTAGDLTGLAQSHTCGGGRCAFFVAGDGQYGSVNDVHPIFTGYSLTDQWTPSEKLFFNLGLRLDQYDFTGADTNTGSARTFWFNSFNHDTCFDKQNLTLYDKTLLADGGNIPITANCSTAGPQYVNAQLNNLPSQRFVYNILQPRIGITYTVDPDTVLRASYGKYNEQPSAAYEQYNSLQANLPDTLVQFYAIGFNAPGHQVLPAVSYNTDFSVEHRFKGTSLSLKLTPFLRQTHNQIENFYTNVKADFISGLNAGNQTSKGFELALNDGDFSRNGFAGQLSFAYTNSYVRYSVLPNGTTILSPINADIQTYNGYTQFCFEHASDRRCGANSANAAPCYQSVGGANPGAPEAVCTSSDVANPYWNAPVQPLLDPNASYLPYSTNPGGIGTGVNAYNYPYVATLILNYKHGRFAVTPSFQFVAGNRYGAPETTPGIDPASACGTLSGNPSHDPRYPYGAAGGLPYDATTCGNSLTIPDQYTGAFDPIGAFRQPAQFLANLRMSYDLSPKATVVLTLTNLINNCFGGQQTGFTYYWGSKVCSYGNLVNFTSPAGNVYNPGDNVQTFLRYPYEPAFSTYNDSASSTLFPFSAYVSVQFKI